MEITDAVLAASTGVLVRLRRMHHGDEAATLAWQSEPGARRYARNQHIPSATEHAAWFARAVADPDCIPMIVLADGQPVGSLRLDRRLDAWEVSILVSENHRGKGIAAAALRLAGTMAAPSTLVAEIHPANVASRRAFVSAGFEPAEGNWHTFRPRPGGN